MSRHWLRHVLLVDLLIAGSALAQPSTTEAQALLRETPGAFMPSQFDNPDNPASHAATTALDASNVLTVVVSPTRNGAGREVPGVYPTLDAAYAAAVSGLRRALPPRSSGPLVPEGPSAIGERPRRRAVPAVRAAARRGVARADAGNALRPPSVAEETSAVLELGPARPSADPRANPRTRA